MPSRRDAELLLTQHITNDALRHHARMVARALAAYAAEQGQDVELWYQTGLLHDLDWEAYPDQHPHHAVNQWLSEYPPELRQAILAHAPERTGQQPTSQLDRYLYACDELSGLLHAISLMRPNGFADMEVKSVKKKLKDKSFAANVSRADIERGAALIDRPLETHIDFLISVFRQPA